MERSRSYISASLQDQEVDKIGQISDQNKDNSSQAAHTQRSIQNLMSRRTSSQRRILSAQNQNLVVSDMSQGSSNKQNIKKLENQTLINNLTNEQENLKQQLLLNVVKRASSKLSQTQKINLNQELVFGDQSLPQIQKYGSRISGFSDAQIIQAQIKNKHADESGQNSEKQSKIQISQRGSFNRSIKSFKISQDFQAEQIIDQSIRKSRGSSNLIFKDDQKIQINQDAFSENQQKSLTTVDIQINDVGKKQKKQTEEFLKIDEDVTSSKVMGSESQTTPRKISISNTKKTSGKLNISQGGRRVTASGNFFQDFQKVYNPWENFETSIFQQGKGIEPSKIILKLQELTSKDLPFQAALMDEKDLDSTDPLDSFIQSFYKVATEKTHDFSESYKKGIHLATGMKTEFCEAILSYICHLQKIECTLKSSVGFFMESLSSVVHLEKENKRMSQEITDLLQIKEGSILEKYNLETRLKKQIAAIDDVQEEKKAAIAKIKQLQVQLNDKITECDSLNYRFKHYHEVMQVHTGASDAGSTGQRTGGAVPFASADEKLLTGDSLTNIQNLDQIQNEGSTLILIDLKASQEKMEEEIGNLKAALSEKDRISHLRKVQELFNLLQIENKNVRIYNQKCENKLQSKQGLIEHLEEKITQVMVEKEQIIIRLKSELNIVKNKLETSDEQFKKDITAAKQKIEFQAKREYQSKVKGLEENIEDLEKQKADLQKRIQRVQKEMQELQDEFQRFRKEKSEQETEKDTLFNTLEEKLDRIAKTGEEKITQLNRMIESSESQNILLKKEVSILQMKQKCLKQQTETLAKQKVFIFETLKRDKIAIETALSKIETSMLQDNNNQAYLVSVEKCISRAKLMADMGTDALSNISQILKFLKLDKLHNILADNQEMLQVKKEVKDAINEQNIALINKDNASTIGSTINQKKDMIQQHSIQRVNIQSYLQIIGVNNDEIKESNTELRQISPNRQTQTQKPQSSANKIHSAEKVLDQSAKKYFEEKNQDFSQQLIYFVTNCPIEVASTCLKAYSEIVQSLGSKEENQNFDQVLAKDFSELLACCEQMSDEGVENKIYQQFFQNMKIQIQKRIQNLYSYGQSSKSIQGQQVQLNDSFQKSNKQDQKSSKKSPHESSQQISKELNVYESNVSPLLMTQKQFATSSDLQLIRTNSKAKLIPIQDSQSQQQNEQLNFEIKEMKNKIESYKLKSKNLQMNLAGKIVVLEEKIEKLQSEKDLEIKQLEMSHQNELELTKQGVLQKEKQLLQLCEEYREEVRDLQYKLETQWRPLIDDNKSKQEMEQKTGNFFYKLMKTEYQKLFDKNAEELATFKSTINEFVNLREDKRATFTLAFDLQSTPNLKQLINFDILNFYLSKIFEMQKDKFRFLRTEYLCEGINLGQEKSHEQIIKDILSENKENKKAKILKLIIEIAGQDKQQVNKIMKQVKSQIQDGTSLLYDFSPLYFGMSLGSSGLSTGYSLKEFSVLQKVGQIIEGVEYVITILRNKLKPLIFKVMAYNLELQEEYLIELSEADIYELVEGNQDLLKHIEPDSLIQQILSNLTIIECDKVKILICIYKVFFNSLWMESMHSKKNMQLDSKSLCSSTWKTSHQDIQKQNILNDSPLVHTAIRKNQIQNYKQKKQQFQEIPFDNKEMFSNSVQVQTEQIPEKYTLPGAELDHVFRALYSLGQNTALRITIRETFEANGLLLEFTDVVKDKSLKFKIYQKESDDQYVSHFECMSLVPGTTKYILIIVEQVQKDGFLIRMFNLQERIQVQTAIFRKANGQYTEVPENTHLDIIMPSEFRHHIYNLAIYHEEENCRQLMEDFEHVLEQQIKDEMKSAKQLAKELEAKKIEQQKKREEVTDKLVSQALPKRKRGLAQARRVENFSLRAYAKQRQSKEQEQAYGQFQAMNNKKHLVDWCERPTDRGSLLFRNVFKIRCQLGGNELLTVEESLITFYLKTQTVFMEVNLYNNSNKYSIASDVLAKDLFGDDPDIMSFQEVIQIIDILMEKFFLVSDENNIFQMKLENEAPSIKEYQESKAKEIALKNPKDKIAADVELMNMTNKIEDIKNDEESFSNPLYGKGTGFRILVENDNEELDVLIIILKKQNKKTEKSNQKQQRKVSTYGMSQFEIRQNSIEQFIDESCDWDSIYFKITDASNEIYHIIFEKKKLAQQMAKDEYVDWQSLLTSISTLFIEYLRKSIRLDKEKSEKVSLQNRASIEVNIFEKYRKLQGGKYLKRKDGELNEDEQKYVSRQMNCNYEINMVEQLYDIKVYELLRKSDKDIISYQLEVFTLSNPDIVYIYNYPINFAEQFQDSHGLVIDIFNLVENPFKKNQDKMLQAKSHTKKEKDNLSGSIRQSIKSTNQNDQTGLQNLVIDLNKQTIQLDPQRKQENQQNLLKKYLDNRLMLFLQEQRFPRKIEFIIIEPCSQINWRHSIEPRSITTGMISMNIVDQASIEQFIALIFDENQSFQDLLKYKDSLTSGLNQEMQSIVNKLFEYTQKEEQIKKKPKITEKQVQDQLQQALLNEVKKQAEQLNQNIQNNEIVENQIISRENKQTEIQVTVGDIDSGERNLKKTTLVGCQITKSFKDIREVNLQESIFLNNQLVLQVCDQNVFLSIVKKQNAFQIQLNSTNTVMMQKDEEDQNSSLMIRIDPMIGDTQITKIIQLKNFNYLVLIVKNQGSSTIVKIVSISPGQIRTAFKFIFNDSIKLMSQQDETEEIKREGSKILGSKRTYGDDQASARLKLGCGLFNESTRDVEQAISDSLLKLYGHQKIEEALRLCDKIRLQIDIENDNEYEKPTIFEQMNNDQTKAINATRLAARINDLLTSRSIILHRKAYFDEINEKLILMQIRIKLNQNEFNTLILEEEAQSFTVVLQDLESGEELEYTTLFDHCLTEQERSSLEKMVLQDEQEFTGYQDIRQLRSLAKQILDERTLIKINDGKRSNLEEYTLEIKFKEVSEEVDYQHTFNNMIVEEPENDEHDD